MQSFIRNILSQICFPFFDTWGFWLIQSLTICLLSPFGSSPITCEPYLTVLINCIQVPISNIGFHFTLNYHDIHCLHVQPTNDFNAYINDVVSQQTSVCGSLV